MRLSIVICSLLLVACFIGEECSDSPVFSDFKAEELKDKIGILIELEGSQIEKCESIWVKISDKPSATNSETKTVVYLLDKIATVWDDDNESVTAGIPEDEQVVQKGNKLQIQILVGLNAETAIPAQLEDGTNLPTADIEIKSGKINWKLIIFIGGCIIGFIIILVLIVNFCICCCRCCYCKPKDKKEKSSKKQKQEMYQQSPYLQRVQSSQQFRQPQLQPQQFGQQQQYIQQQYGLQQPYNQPQFGQQQQYNQQQYAQQQFDQLQQLDQQILNEQQFQKEQLQQFDYEQQEQQQRISNGYQMNQY